VSVRPSRALAILFAALLSWASGVSGAAAKEQWAERLTFSTGRSVTYLSSAPLREPALQAQIAIIVVHGLERSDENSFARIVAAARASGKEPVTLVLAPKFKTTEDQPGADEHFWSSDGWPSGDLSQDDKDRTRRLSSFAVVDRLVAELSDATRFPALRRVVLVGHSAGGQFVNRYVAVGRLGEGVGEPNGRLEYRFVIANPSSYLYLDERRPVPGSDRFEPPRQAPPGYNVWRHGLERRKAYADGVSVDEIRRNVFERAAYYLIGTADSKRDRSLSTSPASMLQGDNRYDRWEKFRRYVGLFPQWRGAVFAEVLGAGHSGAQMFDSRAARQAMFE
jgi:Alpha/beta hydrolase family